MPSYVFGKMDVLYTSLIFWAFGKCVPTTYIHKYTHEAFYNIYEKDTKSPRDCAIISLILRGTRRAKDVGTLEGKR